MYKKFDRISTIDGYLGTIKYIGNLPDHVWGPKVLALGVEWDEPERGKNNGSLEGITYFTTEIEGAGSFIKLDNRRIMKEKYNFVEALVRHYSNDDEIIHETIKFGTKVAENFGFDKLNRLQSDFRNLVSISLERKNIYTSFDDSGKVGTMFKSLNNVTSLDLSFNLINDLNSVWDIVDNLNSLKELNLNGNRFFNLIKGFNGKLHKELRSIKLSSTNIKISQVVEMVLPKFPSLQQISLAGNRYTDSDVENVAIYHPSLLSIDLSFNKLQCIPNLLESLEEINLADNFISYLPDVKIYNDIRLLDFRNNMIQNWDTVDRMYIMFPRLTELRINGNPLFDNLSVEEMTINLIARFECQGSKDDEYKIKKLNGSFMKNDEIESSELFFISLIKKGDINYNVRSQRWLKLMNKYKLSNSDVYQSTKSESELSKKKIELNIILGAGKPPIVRTFLTDNTILRVKGIISRCLGRSILDFKVFYYIDESNERTENKIKQFLEDNIATLDNFGLQQGQNLYVH